MVDIYRVTQAFPKAELYGLSSQLRRAACSVVSNIAEGQGRLTYGEWRQRLSEARGSLYEVQAQVIAAHRLEFLDGDAANHLEKSAASTARALQGLIEWVQRKESEGKKRPTNRPPTTNNQEPTTND